MVGFIEDDVGEVVGGDSSLQRPEQMVGADHHLGLYVVSHRDGKLLQAPNPVTDDSQRWSDDEDLGIGVFCQVPSEVLLDDLRFPCGSGKDGKNGVRWGRLPAKLCNFVEGLHLVVVEGEGTFGQQLHRLEQGPLPEEGTDLVVDEIGVRKIHRGEAKEADAVVGGAVLLLQLLAVRAFSDDLGVVVRHPVLFDGDLGAIAVLNQVVEGKGLSPKRGDRILAVEELEGIVSIDFTEALLKGVFQSRCIGHREGAVHIPSVSGREINGTVKPGGDVGLLLRGKEAVEREALAHELILLDGVVAVVEDFLGLLKGEVVDDDDGVTSPIPHRVIILIVDDRALSDESVGL